MSRKGKKIISIPQGVKVSINTNNIIVSSSKGQLSVDYPPKLIKVENIDSSIKVSRLEESKSAMIFHGTVNSNLTNAIVGLSAGYEKKLKIVGVGYKASLANNKLTLSIGFSHPVVLEIPQGLILSCPTPTEININGYDKSVVGEFAAKIRSIRKPEPYNGKGIMYHDEHIIRKVGKTSEGATAGGGAKK